MTLNSRYHIPDFPSGGSVTISSEMAQWYTNTWNNLDHTNLFLKASRITEKQGKAIFARFMDFRINERPDYDFTFSRGFFVPSGRLFWLDADGALTDVFEFQLGDLNQPLGKFLFGFGEDEDGELYVMTSGNLGPSGNTGEVFRLLAPGDDDDEDDDSDSDSDSD